MLPSDSLKPVAKASFVDVDDDESMATLQFEHLQHQQQQSRDEAVRIVDRVTDTGATFSGSELSCIALQSSSSLFARQSDTVSPSSLRRDAAVDVVEQQHLAADNQDSGIYEFTAVLNK